MALKYALFPGCAATGATPELYQSTMAIIDRLEIEVVELEAASCCGAGVITEQDPEVALGLNARTFAQAERLGLDVMTICGTCQEIMGPANKRLKEDPVLLGRINKVLAQDGLVYEGRVQVKHLLWIVVREIGLKRLSQEVQIPLSDFHIVPFYGCYISTAFMAPWVRRSGESDFLRKGDSSRWRRADFLQWSYEMLWVSPSSSKKKRSQLPWVVRNIKEAKEEGADFMVTPCPLCHMSLDIYQERAGRAVQANLDLPILHLPQLIGLAMGIPAQNLGVTRHLISVDTIVKKVEKKRAELKEFNQGVRPHAGD